MSYYQRKNKTIGDVMKDTILEHWDDLPDEVKAELLESELTTKEMIAVLSNELELELDITDRGNLPKSLVSELVVKLIDRYGELEVDTDDKED